MLGGHFGTIASTANIAFLLAFPSLFSIINPIGGALIFSVYTRAFSRPDRLTTAELVGLYSLMIMFCALWGGAYVLSFFGVSIDALRIAGGTVVALSGWHLLNSGDQHPDRKTSDHQPATGDADDDPKQVAFFPLTLPFTTGPGTIAVAITLGAERPRTAPARSPSSSASRWRRSPTRRSSGSPIASPTASRRRWGRRRDRSSSASRPSCSSASASRFWSPRSATSSGSGGSRRERSPRLAALDGKCFFKHGTQW